MDTLAAKRLLEDANDECEYRFNTLPPWPSMGALLTKGYCGNYCGDFTLCHACKVSKLQAREMIEKSSMNEDELVKITLHDEESNPMDMLEKLREDMNTRIDAISTKIAAQNSNAINDFLSRLR